MSDSDWSECRWGDSILYEPDDESSNDHWGSQQLSLEDLNSEATDFNDFLDTDNDSSALDSFDWQDAVPINGPGLQSLLFSSQSSSSASTDACLSPSSVSSKSGRSRVSGNPACLSQTSIEAAAGAGCNCRQGPQGGPCMTSFDVGDIYRLRYRRLKMSFSEALQHRNNDLEQAYERGMNTCRVDVEGRSVCLQAYCMLFNINWSSARRSWSRLVYGEGRRTMGRPKGSSGGVLSTPKGMKAYAWLKSWIQLAGDEDPVGLKYKFTVNFVVPKELYQEYCVDHASNQVLEVDPPLSCRSFSRVWTLFKKQECVRVRKKANTTTKCQGAPPPPPNTQHPLFLSRC